MKSLLSASFLLATLALLPAAAIAESAPLVVPSSPEALLAALPKAADAWTVVRSDASTTLAETLQTRAVRIYRAPAEANPAPGTSVAQTAGQVTIKLTDLGGRIPGDFMGFKPGQDGAYENTFLGSYPAITFTRDAERRIKVLLANRYVVELIFVNLPREKPESWLQALNFEELRSAKSTPILPTQREYVLRVVDELKPANNRQQIIATSASQGTPSTDDRKK